MTTQTEALKLALEALDQLTNAADTFSVSGVYFNEEVWAKKCLSDAYFAITAIEQALAQPEQEPVTVLPDGSAFAVMSYPLPKDHWLYAERQYEGDADEPNELGKPILTHALRDAVVSAVRYAIRGATNCGKELDFDPDALVQNAVYALCGPYGLAESKKPEQEPVAMYEDWYNPKSCGHCGMVGGHTKICRHYTTSPHRKPLTDEQREEIAKGWRGRNWTVGDIIDAIEAAHGIKE